MNIAITAPKRNTISFATMNRIKDVLFRNDDGKLRIYTTYEVHNDFPNALNLPKGAMIDRILDGELDMLIVVGYHRRMSLIDVAEEKNIDVVLFKEW
jgi:hypothetical protein